MTVSFGEHAGFEQHATEGSEEKGVVVELRVVKHGWEKEEEQEEEKEEEEDEKEDEKKEVEGEEKGG